MDHKADCLSPELEREISKLLQALTLSTLRKIDQGDQGIFRLEKIVSELREAHAAEIREMLTELTKIDRTLGAADTNLKKLTDETNP